jgi:hypothetical protein
LPRLENADLTAANPPGLDRLKTWLDQHIHVHGRPNWVFVKLHTHGGIPRNYDMLLGDTMRNFHAQLGGFCVESNIQLHYVTARELVNIAHAAEDGLDGSPEDYRDYLYQMVRREKGLSGSRPQV